MKKSNLITVSVSAAVLLLSLQSAAAQVCTVPPTCDALGYTKSASECSGMTMLKCPLDQSKVYCPSADEISSSGTYKVGDVYTNAAGVALGTILTLDGTRQHGTVITRSSRNGAYDEAFAYCENLGASTGGYIWSLPTKEEMAKACKIRIPGFSDGIRYLIQEKGQVWENNEVNSPSEAGYCKADYGINEWSGDSGAYFCITAF